MIFQSPTWRSLLIVNDKFAATGAVVLNLNFRVFYVYVWEIMNLHT